MNAESRPAVWNLLADLLERGDPAFVEELRQVEDADRLGAFAAEWYADRRPAARRMLLAYLDHPLNAPRHEALVKRLYKLAEDARDDEVIARFLLAFDRSVRRLRIDRVAQSAGHAPRPLTAVRPPHASTMPRETWALGKARKEPEKYRLFSLKTRNYLRRRAWRYFRLLGKADPARYRALMADLLPRYTDEDFRDGLALLDNWGFVHVLYHHSPALLSLPTGWTLVQGHRLAELAPAPIYPEVWQAAPDVILGLLAAPARPVRRWAIGLLKRDHAAVLAALPAGTLVGWLAHPSPEMVAFGVELLRARPGGLGSLPLEQWLALLEQAPPEALDHLLGLLGDHLRSAARSVGPAVRLASARSPSLAAFGFEVLRSLELNSEEECRAVLGLREAACETLRPQLIRWACEATSRSPYFRPDFVLELLDARFADVRAAGWAWLDAEPRARDEVSLWRRLLESPYDDVRLPLLDRLQSEAGARSSENDKGTPGAAVDAPALVRQLWATILLNVVRGGRRKPAAIGQVLGRLTGRPEEAGELLPVLAAAVRSIRGPEFRAGLTGLVRVVARRPELADAVRAAFPELDLRPAGVI